MWVCGKVYPEQLEINVKSGFFRDVNKLRPTRICFQCLGDQSFWRTEAESVFSQIGLSEQ